MFTVRTLFLSLYGILMMPKVGVSVDYNYPFTATNGGKGGTEYWVTSVDDDADDPNTLRGAIVAAIDSGKRAYIRFNIACTAPIIELRDTMKIDWTKKLTIDGSDQSGGVTIAHYDTVFRAARHLVLRHLRFRPGREGIDRKIDEKEKCDADAKNAKETCVTGVDALTLYTSKNVLIEHCSFNLATDEAFSMKGNKKVIIRHNIISSGITTGGYTHFERAGYNAEVTKAYHNFGSLWIGNDDLVVHNNVWSGFERRCPKISSSSYCCEDGQENTKKYELLTDEDDVCPSDMDFCWGQRASPKLYIFNNVIVGCDVGSVLKGYRGTINLWKNVYLNKNSRNLERSISFEGGDCKWIESADNAFEKRFGNVDDKNTADYADPDIDEDCGSNPNTERINDVSPEQLLQDMFDGDSPGALPHDDVDEQVMEDLEANNHDAPDQDGYYEDPANSKACIKASAFTIGHDETPATSTATWKGEVVCVLAAVAVLLIGGYLCLYRKKKKAVMQMNDNKDEMMTTATGKDTYDMAPLATNETSGNNVEHEEEVEIEVEVEMELM